MEQTTLSSNLVQQQQQPQQQQQQQSLSDSHLQVADFFPMSSLESSLPSASFDAQTTSQLNYSPSYTSGQLKVENERERERSNFNFISSFRFRPWKHIKQSKRS